MKKLILTSLSSLFFCCLCAQTTNAESEIRKLEETERRAVLRNDTATLRKIWDRYLIVNAPKNTVVLSEEDSGARTINTDMPYSSFTREIEQLLVRGDIVISMGNEVIVPYGNEPKEEQSIKRRYTNIWMKQNGTWTLIARHSSIVCE